MTQPPKPKQPSDTDKSFTRTLDDIYLEFLEAIGIAFDIDLEKIESELYRQSAKKARKEAGDDLTWVLSGLKRDTPYALQEVEKIITSTKLYAAEWLQQYARYPGTDIHIVPDDNILTWHLECLDTHIRNAIRAGIIKDKEDPDAALVQALDNAEETLLAKGSAIEIGKR